MKRTHFLRMRPKPAPESPPAAGDRIRMTVTVNVFEGRSFHLLPTPYVPSHLHRDPKVLRQWFPQTLGSKRYVVTLAGKGFVSQSSSS